MSRVQLSTITKTFTKGGARAVDDVTIDVQDGEFLVLLGPSGCGKTTLLRSLAGLERPDTGRIEIGGTTVFDSTESVAVPPNKRDIGMVFQNYSLWPHMTIAQNVAYPLASRRVPKAEQAMRVAAALALVECGHLADRLPSALSGGQQQRIALARAVVAEPRLMLFDEPLSNLDYRLRAQLREEIREIHRRLKFTALYVTHDQTEALQLGTRVAVMKLGRVEQIDTPEVVFSRPASAYVADFLGITNHVPAAVAKGAWSVAGAAAPAHRPGTIADGEYTLYFRASDVELVPAGGTSQSDELRIAKGRIVDVLFGGERSDWVIEVAGERLHANAAARAWKFRVGDEVDLVVGSESVLHYGSDGRLAGQVQ